ncbi:MAG TPA: hypothetical protein VL484_13290 [Vicinamibacterales bacterium]|nr:hypothetical protein [Vicinamibacterales bacterium]
MKNIVTAFILSAACAVGLSAQQSSTDKKQSGPDQWTSPITVTGCLRAGLTAGTFDLTHVKGMPAGHDTNAIGTTGTSGSSATTGTTDIKNKDTITLTSEGRADLSKHVGEEVSVTGRLPKKDSRHIAEGAAGDEQSSGGAVNAGAQPSGMSTMTSGHGIGAGDARMLRVSSIRSISSSCSDSGK